MASFNEFVFGKKTVFHNTAERAEVKTSNPPLYGLLVKSIPTKLYSWELEGTYLKEAYRKKTSAWYDTEADCKIASAYPQRRAPSDDDTLLELFLTLWEVRTVRLPREICRKKIHKEMILEVWDNLELDEEVEEDAIPLYSWAFETTYNDEVYKRKAKQWFTSKSLCEIDGIGMLSLAPTDNDTDMQLSLMQWEVENIFSPRRIAKKGFYAGIITEGWDKV